jgi:hypothetical protein
MPARAAAQSTVPSCTTPDAVTPQANACAGVATKGVRVSRAVMDSRLKNTGAAAAAAKRSNPLSTPDTSAVRQMKSR